MNIPNINPTGTATPPTAPKPVTSKPTGPVIAERKVQASKKSIMTVDAHLYGVKPQALSKYLNDMIKPSPFSGVMYNKTMFTIAKNNEAHLKHISAITDSTHRALLGFNTDFNAAHTETIKQLESLKTEYKKPNITTDKIDELIKGDKEDRRRAIYAERAAQKNAYDPYSDPMYKEEVETVNLLRKILDQGAKEKKAVPKSDFLSSLLKALPLLAGLGGLLGFLLTGKGEFLTDMLKPLKLGFAGLNAGIGGIKLAFSGVKAVLHGMKSIAEKVVSVFEKITGKVVKEGAEIAGKVGGKIAKTGIGKAIAKGGEFIGKSAGAIGKFGNLAAKFAGKAAEKTGIKIIGKVGAKIAAKIPGVGIVIGSAFAIDRLMRGDYTGAGLELASGLLSTVPVIGTAASIGLDVGITGRDVYRTVKGTNKNETPGLWEKLPKLAPNLFGKNKKTNSSAIANLSNTPKEKEPFSIKIHDDSVHMEGLNPGVYNNFMGMAQEYNTKTGKNVQVNSAFRTYEEQAALVEKYKNTPGRAAPAGSSLHETGLAIDIEPNNANEMHKLGLMDKYHFYRPLVSARIPEPWHVQPTNIAASGQDSPNKGDPMPARSLSPEIENITNIKNKINELTQNNRESESKKYSDMLSIQKASIDGLNKVVAAVNNIKTTNMPVMNLGAIAG